MLPEIRKCAEKHDIKGLRYIFIDALDVDPTFEKYREDYEDCRKLDGFFEVHQDLSGLNQIEEGWNSGYWEQLKTDLMKNFSEKRYAHMIQVAKVVYSGKVERLILERERALQVAAKKPGMEVQSETVQLAPEKTRANVVIKENSVAVSKNEMEERRLAEKARALEEENRKIEAAQRAQRERIEAAKSVENYKIGNNMENSGSKKWLGIVSAIVVIAVAILIILMLR